MKTDRNTAVKYGVYSFFLLTVCCLFTFSGCGLDEYYVVEAPVTAYNIPAVTSSTSQGYDVKYFDFLTRDSANSDLSSSGFDYLGTAVYYKIYNNYSTMNTAVSAITSLNSSTTYSAAADKMIDTYGYRELSTTSGTLSPLISAGSNDRRVYIRLMNYQDGDYTAKIIIGYDGSDFTGSGNYVPLRNISGTHSFDFGRTSEDSDLNKVPVNGDSDVNYSSSFSDDDKTVWYVDMFAVAVGRDTTYTKYYSKVLHLGSISIDTSEEDN
jgi:hypothetical protein